MAAAHGKALNTTSATRESRLCAADGCCTIGSFRIANTCGGGGGGGGRAQRYCALHAKSFGAPAATVCATTAGDSTLLPLRRNNKQDCYGTVHSMASVAKAAAAAALAVTPDDMMVVSPGYSRLTGVKRKR